MLIATVEKINGNWYVLNFLGINKLEENIISNWVQCDGSTEYFYNNLVKTYSKIIVKEEDVQRRFINTDSFIYSNKFDLDEDKLQLQKAVTLKEIDFDFNNLIKGIDFMQYLNYISLFNYFASKGIFITEENKEDKYIEILELDDEIAIGKLEEYLNIQETILPFLNKIKENTQLKEDISYSSEEEFQVIKEKLI